MVITLYKQEILNDLRTKSHYEVSNLILDAEARYRVEAGAEKQEDILRCIDEGHSRLLHRCWRYLSEVLVEEGDNVLYSPQEYRVSLVLSERRAVGKEKPLSEAMHTFVVEYALSKFYSDVSQQELSNKHSVLAMEAGDRIDNLLYTKLPPRV